MTSRVRQASAHERAARVPVTHTASAIAPHRASRSVRQACSSRSTPRERGATNPDVTGLERERRLFMVWIQTPATAPPPSDAHYVRGGTFWFTRNRLDGS